MQQVHGDVDHGPQADAVAAVRFSFIAAGLHCLLLLLVSGVLQLLGRCSPLGNKLCNVLCSRHSQLS